MFIWTKYEYEYIHAEHFLPNTNTNNFNFQESNIRILEQMKIFEYIWVFKENANFSCLLKQIDKKKRISSIYIDI